MEKHTIKKAFRRGFTLIELMIVIVILGILMGTILPRVTGGQARARDTGRIADMSNIEQALNVYNVDYGKFPDPDGTGTNDRGCISNTSTVPDIVTLRSYMKGNKLPTPGEESSLTTGCDGYYYATFEWRGEDHGAYLLGSSMDTFQLANAQISDFFNTAPGSAGDGALQIWFGGLEKDITDLGTAFETAPEDMGYIITGTQ